MSRPPERATEKQEPATVSGYLAVALLLAMFAYGVFHVMRAHHSPAPFRMGPVEAQLQEIYESAQNYFLDTGADMVDFAGLLASDHPPRRIESLYGEDYSTIRLTPTDRAVTVQLPGAPQVTYAVTEAEHAALLRRLRLARGIGEEH